MEKPCVLTLISLYDMRIILTKRLVLIVILNKITGLIFFADALRVFNIGDAHASANL